MNARDDQALERRLAAQSMLDGHWLSEGYTMPNRATYPWQWLWDSCFHSIGWAELGDERALVELEQMFVFQTGDGFVPHMSYHPDPTAGASFWGRDGASSITQPPMYGHTIAELIKRGMSPTAKSLDAAARGLEYLFRRRRRSTSGLIELVHPWETGCDDSARWDAALGGAWDRERWRAHKHHLVSTIETDGQGGAVFNDEFAVASIGFNALIAFNAYELDRAVGAGELRDAADELTEAIADRWNPALRTWIDTGDLAELSGGARTSDAHFALLVDEDVEHVAAAASDLVDPAAFGAPFGPRGAHVDEPTYRPGEYWRGAAWPQVSYLLWIALRRLGRDREARSVGASLVAGAVRSGFAEFWNPESGEGAGAIPQSWAALAVLVDSAP